MTDPITYSVAEVAEALGISIGLARAAVKRGIIPSVKVGRRVLVPRSALDAMLSGSVATKAETR